MLMFKRIEFKLGLVIMIIIMVIIIPLGIAIDQIFSGFYFQKVREEIDQLSSRYASSITDLKDEKTLKMYEILADYTRTQIMIINDRGDILANSGLREFPKGSKVNKNDLLGIQKGYSIESEYRVDKNEKHYLVSGKPIFHQGKVIGGVFILSPVDDIHNKIKTVRIWIFLSVISALFLAFIFTMFISRKLSRPLLNMEKVTRRIARGDLEARVESRSEDEIGSLAVAINDLAVELDEYRTNRQEFLAAISHELRTPLTYLEGYANLLKNNSNQSEAEKLKSISIIESEAKRMSRLIQDLFDLSKMEEGKFKLQFEWIDITEVLESAIEKTKIKVKGKNLEVRFSAEKNLSMIYADGERMEQVIINLLENAINYTNKGFIQVSLRARKKDIEVKIIDSGVGIPKDDLQFIFDRFYRVEKSRSREHGGTGLGLAIVKKLVELQGGKISVKSEVGKGTTFVVLFPIEK